MNETWIIILYIGFWILTAIGSIAMIIWAIASRIKEKKIEKSIDFFIVKILKNFAFKRKILNFQRTII